MKKRMLFIFLVFMIKFSFGQQFTDLYGDYLGQTPPGEIPVIFANGIVSCKTLEHSAAVFSSDGNELYWVSRENQESKLNIWTMRRIGNRWTKPEIIKILNDSVNLYDPYLTADGEKLFFGTDKDGNADIWVAERRGNAWNNPQKIDQSINNKDGQCQASIANNGTIYYVDYRIINGKWTCDIMKSEFKNGEYLNPDTLPTCINSMISEDWTPYIAPDESYLIFSSGNEQNYGDLYISFYNKQTNTWSKPLSAGELINTQSQETFPVVSPDGKYLFFTRWTDEKNDMDVYWVSTKFIEKLKETCSENK